MLTARAPRTPLVRRLLAGVAVLFGIATLVAGGRVLAGADPGYVVYRPLVLFNVAMGAAYVAAGLLAWRSAGAGRGAAAAIFFVNLVVLGIVAYLRASGRAVAPESVRAMAFRTFVWLLLLLALGALARRRTVAP